MKSGFLVVSFLARPGGAFSIIMERGSHQLMPSGQKGLEFNFSDTTKYAQLRLDEQLIESAKKVLKSKDIFL